MATDLSLPIVAVAPEVIRRERNRRLVGLALVSPAILLVVLFLYYPVVFIVQMSFTLGSSYLSPAGPDYSTANYAAMASRYVPNVLITLQLAALSTVINLVFGYPFAYVLVRRIRYRDLVRAFMVMNIGAALSNVDPALEEAAVCLGARPWQTFRRILLPLTRSGVIAGILMVFGWNIGTFAEPVLLGSLNEQRALAWTLYQRGVVQTDYGLSSAMSVVLLVIAFIVSYFSLRYSRGALVS
jgi:ABC-type spermidine/putrescine transport system permease subunit I